ncbi:MAG TPA: hypothetical protein VFT30_04765, partial [Nitrospira sp.]|nr:hypothetical protein [Nitrospira sp.]
MSRSTRALIVYMALLVSILLAIPVAAHPVSVSDTSRVDWFGKGRAVANIGIISRNTTGAGEFVWTDAKSDQRIVSTDGATGNILSEIDLVKFNVTADTANLYLLAKMDSITNVTNNPSPELMIAIDSDLNHTGGETALPDGIATNVAATAQWEYVVQTQFTNVSATARPKVFTPTASGICLTCAAQLVSKDVQQGSFIELQIPWDQIGGLPAPENFLRFTVLTHYSDKRAPSDGSSSTAIDVLSTTDTSDELSGDNTINTHFDLHFTSSGEVFAPLLISEFLPDPPGSDTEGEWIEIVNPNSFPVSLQGYKVGDQVYRSGN